MDGLERAGAMQKAIYAFSGDPITFGHIDIVKRAASAFDQVVVGIGANPDKSYLFNLDERFEMARKSFSTMSNVQVVKFSGLLVDFAYENKIAVIVKGVRNSKDCDYEYNLHLVGESQKLGIDTVILFARPELAHVSSSAVKAVQKEQGIIHEYVPLHVKQKLEARISGQYILGVTGEVGSGKSYISSKFEALGTIMGVQVHNIELDGIGHDILSSLSEPKYLEVRQQIAEAFGKETLSPSGMIDRKVLGEIVFNHPEKLKTLNDIMFMPLLVRLRKELYGKRGLIIFNAALIAESNLSFICNNNVLLLKIDQETQDRRLAGRGLSREQIGRRLGSQYNYRQKKEFIENQIRASGHGRLWEMNNTSDNTDASIKEVFSQIITTLAVK